MLLTIHQLVRALPGGPPELLPTLGGILPGGPVGGWFCS